MIIKHAAIEDNWLNEKVTKLLYNSKTLVLGSFNPNNQGNNTDFYYGRCSNFFWKVIADIEGEKQQYYCNSIKNKFEAMEKHSFCFLDLIDSIEISSENSDSNVIHDFVRNKIHTGYSDSVLFTSNTKYKNNNVEVKRTYNKLVLDVLKKGTIEKVIHTIGNSTIGKDFKTKPVEKALENEGFQGYWNSLMNSKKSIDFIGESYSPSAYAVRKLGTENYSKMKYWFETNLINK
jgi:G:T/U-mismatch repair DNA glycosylase